MVLIRASNYFDRIDRLNVYVDINWNTGILVNGCKVKIARGKVSYLNFFICLNRSRNSPTPYVCYNMRNWGYAIHLVILRLSSCSAAFSCPEQ